MKQISIDHAAQMIGVSTATMRNWVKTGYVTPSSLRPVVFSEHAILALHDQIGQASSARLKRRANKTHSKSRPLPEEYADHAHIVRQISIAVDIVRSEQLAPEIVMFIAAIKLLILLNEVSIGDKYSLFDIESFRDWKRKSVKLVMVDWLASIDYNQRSVSWGIIYDVLKPEAGIDYLGLLYQSIVYEGTKSAYGSYFTPNCIIDDALAAVDRKVDTCLDPCCGSGKFLIAAAKHFSLEPTHMFGFDQDRLVTDIAKLNLLLAYPDAEFTPNIICLDSLTELANGEPFCETNQLIGTIDLIATNPPWGAYKNFSGKKLYSEAIRSGETFSLFLEKALKLLRPDGQLSFILPESILKIKIHADIRQYMLRKATIQRICLLGRKFINVYTRVIRLDLIKGQAHPDWLVTTEEHGRINYIKQKRFLSNKDYTFDIGLNTQDEHLLQKIYAVKHTILKNHAEWALGIITGDNNKYIFDTPIDGGEIILRGSDLKPYCLGPARSFIRFTPNNFQQVAPERYYRASEKLIYKFIANRLVFAYDNQQYLTLNSANILIPSILGMSIKVALAFLNSTVFQFIFTKKFATHKVLRGDLEKLPFPAIDQQTHTIIDSLVEIAIKTGYAPKALDEIIFNIFNLSEEEIQVIKSAINN